MILYPNAKINIGLNIIGKRPDGYHNIDSIFYPIPWVDILEIIPASKTQFTYSGDNVNPLVNSVKQTYELMKDRFNIDNLHIHLHKQIPQGAGLGGGSADAAFCLKGINEICQLNLSNEDLSGLALELGSDCPFFIYNKPARVTGRGENIEPILSELSGTYIKLIFPDIHISTAEAFKNIKIDKSKIELEKNNLIKSNLSNLVNDFEQPIINQYPKLSKIKNQLVEEGAIYVSMTGTGSTFYALFENQPKINKGEKKQKVFQLH